MIYSKNALRRSQTKTQKNGERPKRGLSPLRKGRIFYVAERWSDLRQFLTYRSKRLFNILYNVVHVLKAHGEADHARINPGPRQLPVG